MDSQDHTTHTTPSGHENHSVHLCPRCRWPFPNPHPSAKHRRSHKKVCGTIEGYTHLTGPDVVSDDEHHPDDDKEKTPSPEIEKKISIGSDAGGIRGSFSRSEEDLFSDAVTEFSDSATSQGSVHKTLDRDLFFSFNDADNGGPNEMSNTPIEISKVDANLEGSKKIDTNVEKVVETEITKLELTETDSQRSDGLVKDEVVDPAPEKSYVSQLQEAESIDVVVAQDREKGLESQTFETLTEETKDSEISKTGAEVSGVIGGYNDNVKQGSFKKLGSVTADEIVCERVLEVGKASETFEGVEGINEEIKVEKIDLDREITSEFVKESEIVSLEAVREEIKYAPEVAKESEIDETILVVNEKENFGAPKEQILEVVKEPVAVLSEIKDIKAPESEKGPKEKIQDFGAPKEQILEVVKEPVTVLSEIKDLEALELEKGPKEQTQEIVEKHTDEVVEKPDSLLTESQDLGVPILEKCSDEIVVEEPVPVLTKSQDLVAPELEKCSKEITHEVIEQKVDDVNIIVADVSVETVTEPIVEDTSVSSDKIASGVTEPIVEETNSKLINNQDSGAAFSVDSGSRNSLEGNWGSVSVLSTASIDAESLQTTEKSKVNLEKSIPSNTHSPPSFMTPVESEGKDNKNASSDVRDLKQPLTKVNESEVRNKNEEAIEKVINWSATGKQSTPLKNLLGEAKSPSSKQLENVEKNEGNVVNEEVNSPPKLIDDGKNGKKKVKGKSSWLPFVCCSSVNVVT